MIGNIRSKIKYLIIILLVLISAAALTIANSRAEIGYCKNAVKIDGGMAILEEDGLYASVIKLDGSGKMTDRVNILLNDPFTLSVKSVHGLFADNNGNLYLICSIYGSNRSRYETIYKCNFLFGSAQKIWSSKQISGYTVSEYGIPYIDESGIYIPMVNTESGGIDIIKFSGKDHSVVVKNCDQSDEFHGSADSIIYRDNIVFFSDDTAGIFANGKKIYPRDNDTDTAAGLYDAMNYDNGILSFINVAENKIVHYDVKKETFSEEPSDISLFNKLQSVYAYSDGTVTAAYEDGENLRAYQCFGGTEETYSLVTGGFFLRSFLISVVISAVAAALLMFVYTLFFVRIRKQKDGTERYRSIAARITAISTAAGIVCAIVFGVLINNTINKLNSGLQNSIDINGSQFLASYIYTDYEIELKNGSIPKINSRYDESVTEMMENYQTSLAENNGIESYFLLFVKTSGGIFQPGKQFDDSIHAENVVSLRVVDFIRNSIDSGVNSKFEDKMTTGNLQYTCTNFPISDADGTFYNCVLCTVNDAYRVKQTGFMLYIWLIALIFILVVLLLIAANIVLHHNLSGLMRLRKAFAVYEDEENGGDPTVFLLPQKAGFDETSDEITDTGHALMLMTEGIRVHTRDINEGNRKYKRFMAAGILKLMGHSEISKVNFGDHVSQNALFLRFFIDNSSDITERADCIEIINNFIETSGGILLNFCSGKADICVIDKNEYGRAADTAARLGFPSVILAAYGKVEAGSAGSDGNAWLIALSDISDEFAELEKLEIFEHPRTAPMICTKKAEGKLKNDKFFSRYDELRSNVLGDVKYFEIIPREIGEENDRETIDSDIVDTAAADNSLHLVL